MAKGYIGIWYGGTNYSPGYWEVSSEYFPTLKAAETALWMRRHRDWDNSYPVRFDDYGMPHIGHNGRVNYPLVDNSSRIWLIPYGELPRDSYPTHIVSFGPRGGIRVERG